MDVKNELSRNPHNEHLLNKQGLRRPITITVRYTEDSVTSQKNVCVRECCIYDIRLTSYSRTEQPVLNAC